MASYFFSENPCIFLAALSSSRSLVVSLLVSDICEKVTYLPSYVTVVTVVTFLTVVTVVTVVKEVTLLTVVTVVVTSKLSKKHL